MSLPSSWTQPGTRTNGLTTQNPNLTGTYPGPSNCDNDARLPEALGPRSDLPTPHQTECGHYTHTSF
ncbi:hypothetical protein L210DRAFT_3546053 [Boletus edulis BED1]|uniref:Uncharacterized protein n=1 Tax=Boletus edulis BED1 TaxID=1328754 RepID=A0AAD4GCK1_BOLED|nr:hypothetical protein L210DRAFT_3546053 [Boletus edulis BED1]